MDDSIAVHVFDGEGHLKEIALGLDFGEALAAFDEFVEGLVGAHLEKDVDALGVLEEVLEAHDVLEFQGTVDPDLGGQLRMGTKNTFYLALERVSEAFSMTLAA